MSRAPYRFAQRGYHPRVSDQPTAAQLLRGVGLLTDGPLPWGRPIPERGAGVFIVELPGPLPAAPIELTRVGKWLERVPDLRLDGDRPTSRALAARLASFWLPGSPILFIGASGTSIHARVDAMERTVLGDRRPHAGGYWLKTLSVLPTARVWWAQTDAAEEYEDALFTAFAEAAGGSSAGADDPSGLLPFANLRRPTGERRPTGITGALLVEAVQPPVPATTIVELPDGDADGARRDPVAPGSRSRGRSAPARPIAPPRPVAAPPPVPIRARVPRGTRITLTAAGVDRLSAELDELTRVRRPEIIGRIRAAKELGDLKENADYTAAREEQSFLEGRVQALEARLRDADIAEEREAGAHADIGSVVTVEVDGLTDTYTLVGSAEANPSAGRLSVESPVGRALVGMSAGDTALVRTPRGEATYRVIRID